MGNRPTRKEPAEVPSSMTELPHEENPPNENQSVEPTTPSSSSKLPEEPGEGLFKEIEDTGNIDELINTIQRILQGLKSKLANKPENGSTSSQPAQEGEEESGIWKSIIRKGSEFLERLNKLGASEELNQGIKVVAATHPQGGTVAGLSAIAFLLSKYEKMRDNQPQCLQALGDLIDLARHLRSLKKIIPAEEEKYTKAIHLIVEGSITCLRQSEDNKLFRFIKSSINCESLMNLQKRIKELYPNLVLTSIIDIRKDIPTRLPIAEPAYPVRAVGIEKTVREIVDDILRTTEKSSSSVAVVIYGLGGLGKTTVAEAVVSNLDLNNYNHTRIDMYQEQEKNDFTRLQKQILEHCFPDYIGGKSIELRDCKDGGDQLMQAFRFDKNKAIFLFIDNVSRSSDLKSLLPQDLEGLPQGSIILVTARNLAFTNIFEGQGNLIRRSYALQPLPFEDAVKVLFKDPDKVETIKDDNLNKIVKICSCVPLALNIVAARLHRESNTSKILETLKNEDTITLENGDTFNKEMLSDRAFYFVYGELEEFSKEALLDICCFFNGWNRQEVEYIVGAMAITSLLEAGLIISAPKHNDPLGEELIVHDIIRAKGQRLAKSNRIYDVESLRYADKQNFYQAKGVWLVKEEFESTIEERVFNRMRTRSLRILGLGEGIQVDRVSNRRFEKLRFLRVSGDSGKLPVKLEEFDRLRVFHGPFFTEGEVSLCKLPKSLVSMKVIGKFHSAECTKLQMTGAPPCISLKKLDFSELEELPNLPKDFNQLTALEILILDDIEKMLELPEQFCQLPILKSLSMRKCKGLKYLPESFGQLTTLTDLNLSECGELQKLSNSFGQLAALRSLNLSYCYELVALPDNFGQLTALKDLNLCKCGQLNTLPHTFNQLTSLQNLECSRELKSRVPSPMPNKELHIRISDEKAPSEY